MHIGKEEFQKNHNMALIEQEIASSPLLSSILNVTPIALNLWDSNMTNIFCNEHVLHIFSIDDEREYLERFHKFSPEIQPNGISSQDMAARQFQKACAEGRNVFHWMHCTLKGEPIPSEITLIKLDIASDIPYLIGFIRDLRHDFLQINDKDYDYYFTDALPTNILLHEISGLSAEWFFSVDMRTGKVQQYRQSDALITTDLFATEEAVEGSIVHKDDMATYKVAIDNLKRGIVAPCDLRLKDAQGEYHYHRLIYKVISDHAGTPVFLIGKGVNIHEQKLLEERSQRDLLTGCFNKISAEQLMLERIKRSPDGTHALFIIDIDNFKGINDNLGHFFGDEVLREIADGLHTVFREGDIIARIGGDEFVVFLENITDMALLEKKADSILAVYQRTYSGEYKDYVISGSVGVALYPNHGNNYETLYQNADKALYQAKLLGKNRYIPYSEDLRAGTMRSVTKIENANRIASAFFDYDLISTVFNILYERGGDDTSIDFSLKYIGQKYGADRSYIFESLDGLKTYSNTFEWCQKGIHKEIDNLQKLPYEIFADLIEKAHNGIIYSNDLRETLQLDSAFEVMNNQGILSFVHAQVRKEGKMTFFIGLDDCTKTRVWSEKEINSLQYIGKLLSIMLQGSRLRGQVQTLAERNKSATHILDNTDEFIYITDIENHELIYLNRRALEAIGNPAPEEWYRKKCYEVLQGGHAPCDFCNNDRLTTDDFHERSHYNKNLHKQVLVKEKLIPFNGKLVRLEIATDISKVTALEVELQEKLMDERFLANCVKLLHSGSAPKEAIYKLLKRVTTYFQAERSYIFEVCEDGQHINNTYEWCHDDADAYREHLQQVEISELGLLFERCKERQTFAMSIDDPQLSPNSLEYQLMKFQNIDYLIISPIISADNEVTGFVGIDNPTTNHGKELIMQSVAKFIAAFLDETELVAKLNQLSYYDSLTGIKNRQSYSDAVTHLNQTAVSSLGVIYVDIKGLRIINDANGFLVGDCILRALAGILTTIFGQDVYRVGGDEFVVFKKNIEEQIFEDQIAVLKETLQQQTDFCTTIGYTFNHHKDDNISDFAHLTGAEKYNHILSENLKLELENDKFAVFLQPQITLATGKVHSAEALVRRVGSGGLFQPPVSFIPFYEKEGIISKIDTFVFERVCQTLQQWKRDGYTDVSTIAVNCSRMTIAEEGVVEHFCEICARYGVDRSQLVIEITETTNEISEQVLKSILQKFRAAGFLVSLDDFGSGYSNLTSFVISDYDEVKVDMKLVNDIHLHEKAKALTEVVLILCQKLNGLLSVAEGIEVSAQYDILKEMGCAKGQGYFFDKPLPIEDFSKKYVYTD